VEEVARLPLEKTPMDQHDRQDILRLLNEGNDKGALALANDLFPSMNLEETAELVNEISLDENEDNYDF
jgi:hypothetical protein